MKSYINNPYFMEIMNMHKKTEISKNNYDNENNENINETISNNTDIPNLSNKQLNNGFKLSTGNGDLNDFLEGGYDRDVISTFFGPSGSGKTTLCIIAAIEVARSGKKVIYIDTEASFSVERLKQIAYNDYNEVMASILFLKPLNFDQQQKSFDKLRHLVDDSIGLIIVDTISMLYRLAVGQSRDVYDINKKLSMQLSYLTEISRKSKIPILIANQVYSSFEEKDKVNMVGGDILKYSSKTLIELKCLKNSIRRMVIQKARSLPEGNSLIFKLTDKGIEKIEE